MRTATCSCGALRVEADGEPVRVSVCHCHACQKRTGSAFGAQARFPEGAVRITGESSAYTRAGDSGNTITFHFCPRCGSTVHYRLAAVPGFVVVALGAFAGERLPAPTVAVYEARKLGWVVVDGEIEHID